MNNRTRNLRSVLAVLALSYGCVQEARAETLQAGEGSVYADVCNAISAAAPGDTIEVSGAVMSSQCAWNTPNLTIKGVGVRPLIKVEGGFSIWSIAAENTTIENLGFEGAQCADNACAAIDLVEGSLTLRTVSIRASDVGVRANNAEGATLAIEHCDIAANRSNIDVGNIARFALVSSYIRDAKGGAMVKTAAVENNIAGNRLVSGPDSTAYGEVVIAGSRSTEFSGNVIVRTEADSTAGLLQYVDVLGAAGEVTARSNTFVNRAISGIEFIEAVGEQRPTLHLERNVFWGEAPTEWLSAGDAAWSNYFGTGDIFRGDTDFRLAGEFVPAEWGAVAISDSAFPLEGSQEEVVFEEEAVSDDGGSAKGSTRSAVGVPGPASLVLRSTLVSGSLLVFSNRVTLSAPAPAGGVTVTLRSSDTSVVQLLSPSIVIAAGSTTGTFGFMTIVSSVLRAASITASANGRTAAASVQVVPVSVARVTLQRTPVGSNSTLTGNRVELTGPAPAGGMVIALRSSSTAAAVQSSVTIPAGVSSMSFTINARLVYSATVAVITATHASGSKSASLSVLPVGISRVYLSPTAASGGQSVAVKVFLNGPAPSGGLEVDVRSSNSSVLPVPSSITVPAGFADKGVVTTARYVSAATSLTVTASTGSMSASTPFTGIRTQLANVLFLSRTVAGGGSVTGILRLTGPAPTGGMTVYLSSSAPRALSVPLSIFFPAGSREMSFTARSTDVGSSVTVTVTGTGGGESEQATITVN